MVQTQSRCGRRAVHPRQHQPFAGHAEVQPVFRGRGRFGLYPFVQNQGKAAVRRPQQDVLVRRDRARLPARLPGSIRAGAHGRQSHGRFQRHGEYRQRIPARQRGAAVWPGGDRRRDDLSELQRQFGQPVHAASRSDRHGDLCAVSQQHHPADAAGSNGCEGARIPGAGRSGRVLSEFQRHRFQSGQSEAAAPGHQALYAAHRSDARRQQPAVRPLHGDADYQDAELSGEPDRLDGGI